MQLYNQVLVAWLCAYRANAATAVLRECVRRVGRGDFSLPCVPRAHALEVYSSAPSCRVTMTQGTPVSTHGEGKHCPIVRPGAPILASKPMVMLEAVKSSAALWMSLIHQVMRSIMRTSQRSLSGSS